MSDILPPTLGIGITSDVGAVAKLADDGLALVSQPIKSAQLDKPINEALNRTASYESILNETDPNVIDIRLGNFISSLFNDANIPIGEFSGRTRKVPVESLNGFITGLIQYIELHEQNSANAASK